MFIYAPSFNPLGLPDALPKNMRFENVFASVNLKVWGGKI